MANWPDWLEWIVPFHSHVELILSLSYYYQLDLIIFIFLCFIQLTWLAGVNCLFCCAIINLIWLFSYSYVLADGPDWLDGDESAVGSLLHNCLLHRHISPGEIAQKTSLVITSIEGKKRKINWHNWILQVMRVLRHYESQGLLQMIPWQWPLTNKQFRFSQIRIVLHVFRSCYLNEWFCKYVHIEHRHFLNFKKIPHMQQSYIRYFGQNLLLHDCLHRSRQRNNFTIFTDMDEHIVPVNVSLFHHLIFRNNYLKIRKWTWQNC